MTWESVGTKLKIWDNHLNVFKFDNLDIYKELTSKSNNSIVDDFYDLRVCRLDDLKVKNFDDLKVFCIDDLRGQNFDNFRVYLVTWESVTCWLRSLEI